MPYEISLRKSVTVADDSIYINDCCRGGDVIRDYLLPFVEAQYQEIETLQEDWGWFIWFRTGDAFLEINITTDSKDEFRIHLVSARRKKKFLFMRSIVVDLPELEDLKTMIVPAIESWANDVKVEKLDENFR